MRRASPIAGIALAFLLARPVAAAPTIVTTKPARDPLTGEFVILAGGINELGRSLKFESIELALDGARQTTVPVVQPFSDWATVASEGNATWRPPIAIGVVYLWVEGVPSGVLDGLHAFAQRLPPRTTLYPTVYGRMRQGRAKLTASEISRLDEIPHLDGYRPNLIDAIRLNAGDVGAERVPLKLILLVTDGRDFADPKGDGPGDFAALGRDLRKAGITPLVLGFPPPAADSAQAAVNLSDLRATGGGFLRILQRDDDLENTLESLGQAIADLQRVRFSIPWNWQVATGTHRAALRLTTTSGHRLSADAGTFNVPVGKIIWIGVGGGAVAVLVIVLLVAILWRRSRGADTGDADDDVVAAAHDLIRRGTPPARAAQELATMYPTAMHQLAAIDEDVLNDPRYPYFRTRPGRMRLEEIRNLIANKRAHAPGMSAVVAEVIANALGDNMNPSEVAVVLEARASSDESAAFAGLSLDQLAEVLRIAARRQPALATPRARGVAVAIQDALRARGAARGIAVAWLVRAAGPGPLGETMRLRDGRTLVGAASGCDLRISDPLVNPEQFEITSDSGEFSIQPLRGSAVTMEGKPIAGRTPLADGDSIGIGGSLFVFKLATAGNLSRPRSTVAENRPPRSRVQRAGGR